MNDYSDFEQLFSTMMQLGKLMSQQTQETHEERIATALQLMALQFLNEQSNGTVSDIANFLKLSKSSTTQLIERLVKVGFVARIHDKEDRRIVRLNITKNGEKEFEVLKHEIIEKMKKTLDKIPEKDILELIRIHTDLIDTLKKQN